MTKFEGLYEVAAEVFDNLAWRGMEAVIRATDSEDVYSVGYRRVGNFGDLEDEHDILCTIELSPELWYESLSEWHLESILRGYNDLDDDLIHDYIADAMTDHINYRMYERFYELEQAAREYAHYNQEDN